MNQLFINSTGSIHAEFLLDLLDGTDPTQITTGTVLLTLVSPSGSTLVNAQAMTYDATKLLKTGWPRTGCWTYTVASTDLSAEGDYTVTIVMTTGSGVVSTIQFTVPAVSNTG